ncbi:MAG TPA: acyl-CoA dehydrogenase family protein [Polyangiaceae bacterium]|jgi:alkylation response protein AidB-like acyl-CoA dehydrogenase|nr:acyl-CoA dehydrogenase family protein [Polyangiaceae bacterium]
MPSPHSLALTEDQAILARTALAFSTERLPLARVRKLREPADGLGYSREIWSEMAKLGWTGIPFAEVDGGADLGLAEVVLVTEALGRCLAPEPFVPSIMLAGQALAVAGNERQRESALKPLVAGDKIVALALLERGSRHDLRHVTTRADKSSAGYRITGSKAQVSAGYKADAFIVPARTSGEPDDPAGITLVYVPADSPGLGVTRQHLIDGRNAAIVELRGVEVSESAVLGTVGGGGEVLDAVVDRATVALCGEMLGAMSEAFDRTLAYLKERTQFGVAIGSFQALKHRAARMFVEIQLARSAVMAAARAMDQNLPYGRALVSAAKARCSDAHIHVANEAVQMHGGIGMTDEHDIGLFMKHARATEMTFGDAAFHRNRFATLGGF